MDAQERTDFISSYSRLLVAAWSDEALAERLVSDPKPVLAQFGLTVPDGTDVTVVRRIPAQHAAPDVDVQVDLWEQGLTSGHLELRVPETPQIDMSELSDSELEAVAGGMVNVSSAGHVTVGRPQADWSLCCSCTPCCSCA